MTEQCKGSVKELNRWMKNAGDYNAKCLFPKQVEVVRVIGMPINSISNTSDGLILFLVLCMQKLNCHPLFI